MGPCPVLFALLCCTGCANIPPVPRGTAGEGEQGLPFTLCSQLRPCTEGCSTWPRINNEQIASIRSSQLALLIIFLKDANRGHPLPDTQPVSSCCSPSACIQLKSISVFNPLLLGLRLSFVSGFLSKQASFYSVFSFFIFFREKKRKRVGEQ